jgi:GDP-L-fucose synthase
MPRRVAVTGATGFIGRNVAEALATSGAYDVVATYHRSAPFDHPAIKWVRADLTVADDCRRALEGVDVVVQAAATTSGVQDITSRPYIHVADNAVLNSHLFRACFDQAVGHLIFFSCAIMYQSSDRPLAESDFDLAEPLHPSYFGAGWTKLYLEKMCEFYARLGRTRYTVIRHSNIYGPHDKFDLERSHVFGATVTKVLTAADRVVVWGAGEERRDLLYVSDLVEFVRAAIDRQVTPFELCNVGYGQAISVKELVAKIVAASGRPLRVEHDLTRPSIKTSVALDTTRARELFDWSPRVSLDEGIARTIEWWRNHRAA